MFANISWGEYCIAVGLLVLVWYAFLGFRFYQKKLKQIVSGKRNIKFPSSGSNRTEQFRFESKDKGNSNSILLSSSESLSTLEDAEELSGLIVSAVKESAERNLPKAALQNYLKLILNDFPFVKESTLRVKVNELMVSECEKHPQIILTYEEVDGLWDETI